MKRKSFSNSQGSGNGIHIQFNKLYELRKKNWGLLKKKICRSLFYVDVPKWTSVKLDLFLAWHVIESLLHKKELLLIFSAKKLICIGDKSVPQTACLFSGRRPPDWQSRPGTEAALASRQNSNINWLRSQWTQKDVALKDYRRRNMALHKELRELMLICSADNMLSGEEFNKFIAVFPC